LWCLRPEAQSPKPTAAGRPLTLRWKVHAATLNPPKADTPNPNPKLETRNGDGYTGGRDAWAAAVDVV
jgi:hypothetical protein